MLRAASGQDARCLKGGIRSMRRPSRGFGHRRRGIVQSTGSSRSRDDTMEHLDKGKRAVLQVQPSALYRMHVCIVHTLKADWMLLLHSCTMS